MAAKHHPLQAYQAETHRLAIFLYCYLLSLGGERVWKDEMMMMHVESRKS